MIISIMPNAAWVDDCGSAANPRHDASLARACG
jgi:hypothetical protein